MTLESKIKQYISERDIRALSAEEVAKACGANLKYTETVIAGMGLYATRNAKDVPRFKVVEKQLEKGASLPNALRIAGLNKLQYAKWAQNPV